MDATAMGLIFWLVQMSSISSGVVLQKPLLQKYPPVVLVVATYMVAFVPCSIIAVAQVGMDVNAWMLGGDPLMLFCLCYVCLLTTTFNYIALAWGNKHTSPTTVTGYFPLQPM